MSDYNSLFTILYIDNLGKIHTYEREEGGIYLSLSFQNALCKCNELNNLNDNNIYKVHSIEVHKDFFN